MSLGQSEIEPVHLALALHGDQTVGALVFDGAAGARFDGQFLGGEKLLAVNFAIDDPAIGVALAPAPPAAAIGSR